LTEEESATREIAKLSKSGEALFIALYHRCRDTMGVTLLGWINSESWEKRRKVRFDRKHLEAKTRRFLIRYLAADQTRKPKFYRAIEDVSRECRAEIGVPLSQLEDSQIAEATSEVAIKAVLAQEKRAKKKDSSVSHFMIDASATVAVAYRRASRVYTVDKDMQELGTAAVHLLTMATSYMNGQDE
jgi:hypothetical protein